MSNATQVISTAAEGALSEIGNFIKGQMRNDYTGWSHLSSKVASTLDSIAGMIKPFTEVQSAAIELTKALGLAGSNVMSLSQRTIAANKELSLSMKYDISNDELLRLQQDVLTNLGRNMGIEQGLITDEQGGLKGIKENSDLENLAAMGRIYDSAKIAELIESFDKYGKSITSAAKASGKLFSEAGKYGINLYKYSENFVNNLDMAQSYTFRKGVDGLREMARKATEIRQDMRQVAAFADKVGSVTGAVETAANLQVLGGSFTRLANPLSMLNESLTNMEGLQDRMIEMTKGQAFYDSVSHEIRMDPVTRQLMKRAASSMGLDPNNLIDQAYAQARRGEIERQMTGMGNFSAEVARLLPNVGKIDEETGLAGATIGGEFKTLSEISASPELQKQLIAETRSESEDIKEIAQSVMGIENLMSGRRKQLENEEALNKVKPGVLDGVSQVDAVVDLYLNTMNDKFISAISKISFPFESLGNVFRVAITKSVSELAIPFDETTMDGFKASMSNAIKNALGEGGFSTVAGELVNSVTEALYKVVNGFQNKVLGPAGVNLTETAMAGSESIMPRAYGAGTVSVQPVPETTAQATAVTTTAAAMSRRGETVTGQTPDIEEALTNLYGKYVSPDGSSVTFLNLYGTSQDILQPTQPVWGASENSMPTNVVQPNKGAAQKEAAGETAAGGVNNKNDYNFKFEGSIQLKIEDPNGKVTSDDLLKMLQGNTAFRQEFLKLLLSTMSSGEAQGMMNNK